MRPLISELELENDLQKWSHRAESVEQKRVRNRAWQLAAWKPMEIIPSFNLGCHSKKVQTCPKDEQLCPNWITHFYSLHSQGNSLTKADTVGLLSKLLYYHSCITLFRVLIYCKWIPLAIYRWNLSMIMFYKEGKSYHPGVKSIFPSWVGWWDTINHNFWYPNPLNTFSPSREQKLEHWSQFSKVFLEQEVIPLWLQDLPPELDLNKYFLLRPSTHRLIIQGASNNEKGFFWKKSFFQEFSQFLNQPQSKKSCKPSVKVIEAKNTFYWHFSS